MRSKRSRKPSASLGSSKEAFHERLQELCGKLNLTLSELPEYDPNQLRIEFSPNFPMWITIDVDQDSDSAVLLGVVRTVGFPGDRSDYHDLISLLWAAFLRSYNFASVRLLDIPHPVCEGELYGRYLFFEKHPSASFVSLKTPNYELIERLLTISCRAAQMFSFLYQVSDGDPDRESCEGDGGQRWAKKITRHLRWKTGRNELTNQRHNPDWCYYRRNDRGVTAFILCLNLLKILSKTQAASDNAVLDFDDQYLVRTDALRNTMDKKAVSKLFKLLGAYGVEVGGTLPALLYGDSALFLPTDSHLICVTGGGIMAFESEGGDDRTFRQTESRLRVRHQKEAKFLHSTIRFCWTKRMDDDRFEELMYELLEREPGVRWVRRVGAARASDGGRDLIAEWLQPPADWESATESQALVCRHVVIQCKAYAGSVNRTIVGDVPGTVDLHDANGYLLIAYPRITPQLVDYLTKVPAKRKICADFWTSSEIENRLRSNIDIAQRYPDLFSIVT